MKKGIYSLLYALQSLKGLIMIVLGLNSVRILSLLDFSGT
jgi:hypothetical protein